MSKPVVAIVGRPNVGKSTLFNVLAGDKISIVKDTPGVTRDRIYADVSWLDNDFTIIDTGGIEPDSGDVILSQMREQAQIAIDTADVIIFITDVHQGLVDEVRMLMDMGLTKDDISMKGIGYKEIMEYLEGSIPFEEAVDNVKKNTRHYAKKQLTWFRRYDKMNWYNISEFDNDDNAAGVIAAWVRKNL